MFSFWALNFINITTFFVCILRVGFSLVQSKNFSHIKFNSLSSLIILVNILKHFFSLIFIFFLSKRISLRFRDDMAKVLLLMNVWNNPAGITAFYFRTKVAQTINEKSFLLFVLKLKLFFHLIFVVRSNCKIDNLLQKGLFEVVTGWGWN